MSKTNSVLRKVFCLASLVLGTLFATSPEAEARYCPIHDPIALLHAILYGPGPEGPAQSVRKERYIVHGQLEIDAERTVKSRTGSGLYYLKGYLTGKSLTKDGFVNRFEAPVLMKSYCDTVSCEFLSDEVLVYIYRDRGRFHIYNDFACNLGVYRKPDQETLDGMVSCLRGEECPVTDHWYGVNN